MSYTIVKDASMLFDDSRFAIIPLDKNFEPDFEESEIYTSIFSVSYKECKREFITSVRPRRCYVYPIGKGKYVIYLVDYKFSDSYMNEVVSVVNRYLNKSNTVSLLVKDTSSGSVKSLCSTIPFNVKVYDKALSI